MTTYSQAPEDLVLVLGMHRSGTSASAAALEHLGVFLGHSLLEANEWNPKGYFEERNIIAFNNHLLALNGLRWDSLAVRTHIETALENERHTVRQLLQEIFQGHNLWGIKDPRMCLLSSFWKPMLAFMGIKPRLLLVLRDPAQVAHSLARRNGIATERSAWLWFLHLLGSLEYVEEGADARILAFADLLHEPATTLRHLASWLDLQPKPGVIEEYASEFISPDLAQDRPVLESPLPPLVERAFAYWQNVARQDCSISAATQASQWQEIKDEFKTDIAPSLEMTQRLFTNDRQLSLLDMQLDRLNQRLALAEELSRVQLEMLAHLNSHLKHGAEYLACLETELNLAKARLSPQ